MGYEYRPSAKGQGKPKQNKFDIKNVVDKLKDRRIVVAAVVLVVAVFIFTSFSSFTGFVAEREAEQKKLQEDMDLLAKQRDECNTQLVGALQDTSQCKNSIDALSSQLNTSQSENAALENDLTSTQANLTSCQSDLSAANLLTGQLNSSLTQCGNEKTLIQGKLDQLQTSYDKLSTSSAKAICCRPGITTSQWSISGDSITCSGDKIVTC